MLKVEKVSELWYFTVFLNFYTDKKLAEIEITIFAGLGNGLHVLGNGPHVLGNGPHVIGNKQHILGSTCCCGDDFPISPHQQISAHFGKQRLL